MTQSKMDSKRCLSVIMLAIMNVLGSCTSFPFNIPPHFEITGLVISLRGDPVSGASVSTSIGEATTRSDGRFQVSAREYGQWVTVKHPDFLTRTRAAAPGVAVLIRLTPDDGETISLTFAGDTMFGRRFYDPNEDGDASDALLRKGADMREHLALLQAVQPLLESSDITTINLETPLTTDAYTNSSEPRPAKFHSSKDYAFASDLVAAVALKEAGVDVVDLGNNHLYDALDEGVASTLDAVSQAGLAAFGAGMTEAQAWTPAVITTRGQSVAFLGCTTITGTEHDISYVVSDAQHKGGAASCNEQMIRKSVAAARAKYTAVVMMIHGGYEYKRLPSQNVKQLTTAAREAGATLVINHHPHVVGGFEWNGTSLVAWTLGNFLFDQTVWPTLQSYLLTVHLRNGQVVRAYTEPLMIEDFVPKGLIGGQADYIAREAAGRVAGPYSIEDGAMEVDIQHRAARFNAKATINGEWGPETIVHLPPGWWMSDFAGQGPVRLGRDLLWVGSFEDEDIDDQHLEGALWALEDSDKQIDSAYAYEGNAGIRLQRNARHHSDSVLTPLYRLLVEPGQELSLIGMVRASADARVSLQLSWYSDTRGPSDAQTVRLVQLESSDVWTSFQLDSTVPPDAVAVGIFVRLNPPASGYATVDLDNIRLIEWAPAGPVFSPLYDHIKMIGSGEITLSQDMLPGAAMWATPPLLKFSDGREPIRMRVEP